MKEVYLEFYNHSFVLQGLISQFSSLTWVQRFQDVGTFELVTLYTEEIKSWLSVDMFVMRSDSNQVYYVDSVEYSRDINGNKQIRITGSDVVKILNRRVLKNHILTAEGVTTNLSSVVSALLYYTAKSGLTLESNRALDSVFNFDWSLLPSATLDYNLFGVNLLEQLYEYAKTYKFGITAIRTPEDSVPIKISFQKMVDKSATVIFSEGMKNLAAWSYSQDISEKVNTVYVKKHEFDVAVVNQNSYSGLNRFEAFTDSGISDQKDDGTTIPDATYTKMLQDYGKTLLHLNGLKEIHIESEETVFKYPSDYVLGDIVFIDTEIENNKAVIAEVTEIFDATGYAVFPTFDTNY